MSEPEEITVLAYPAAACYVDDISRGVSEIDASLVHDVLVPGMPCLFEPLNIDL